MPNVQSVFSFVRLWVILGRLVVSALSSSSSIKGVAVAVTATVHAVRLALDGYGPLNGVGDWQVLELGHDLTTAYLLSNVLGAAVRLGHAVNEETG